MQKPIRPSVVLASFSWFYVFAFSALAVLRIKPPDGLTWASVGFFFIIAVFASAIAYSKPKMGDKQMRININGVIYTNDALTIHDLKDGDVFIYVDTTKPMKSGKSSGPDMPPAHMVGKRK